MATRARKGFTLVELLVVIVIIALLAALLLPAIIKALCSARQGATKHLIEQLSQAAKNYELEQNAYPPGTGSGSSELSYYLKQFSAKKLQYFEFRPDMLDGSGNIWSPVRPLVDILYYKNNAGAWPGNQSDPSAHNKQSFDIWCKDCSNNLPPIGGVTNWD